MCDSIIASFSVAFESNESFNFVIITPSYMVSIQSNGRVWSVSSRSVQRHLVHRVVAPRPWHENRRGVSRHGLGSNLTRMRPLAVFEASEACDRSCLLVGLACARRQKNRLRWQLIFAVNVSMPRCSRVRHVEVVREIVALENTSLALCVDRARAEFLSCFVAHLTKFSFHQ